MKLVYKKDGLFVKFFTCLFVSIVCLFLIIGTSVFAASQTISINDSNLIIDYKNKTATIDGHSVLTDSNIWNYDIAIFSYANGYSRIVLYKDEHPILKQYGFRFSEPQTFYFFNYEFKNDGSSYLRFPTSLSDFSNYTGSVDDTSFYSNVDIANFIRFSTTDIYDKDGNVVFQAPPQEQATTLAPIVEEQEMKPLGEILGIIPVVIIVLVGLIAIRKAIHWIIMKMKMM